MLRRKSSILFWLLAFLPLATFPAPALELRGFPSSPSFFTLTMPGQAAPALSPSGQGRLYFDSTSNTFRLSQHGGAYMDLMGSGSGNAPVDATYVTQTPNATLTAEQALSALGTGYLKVTTGTGVLSSQAIPFPVADGGTGLTAGTSGGILGYTATGTLASSALLTANALVLGGGAGVTPTALASLGTTTTLLHGNAAGPPTFGAVSLTADVSGILPGANGGTSNGFFAVAGPTTSLKTFTFPDASSTVAVTSNTLAVFAATTSAQLAGVISDETGTGVAVFGTAPTFTTNITVPLVIGGAAIGSNITHKSTTGAGTPTGIAHQWTGGTDGATVIATMLNNGNVGIGTTSPGQKLHVALGTTTGLQSAVKLSHGGAAAGENVAIEFSPASGAISSLAKIVGVAPGSGHAELGFYTSNGGAAAVEIMRITGPGNVGIMTTNFGTGMTGGISQGIGVGPSTSPPDVVQEWVADWNGAGTAAKFWLTEEGAQHVMGSKVGFGTITPLQLVHASGSDATVIIQVGNTNAANKSKVRVINLASDQVALAIQGSTAVGTTAGLNNANLAEISADPANALLIRTVQAQPIVFAANNTEFLRVGSTGFITFQGQTASFPGWKRVSAGLECRLGDDSDYCTKFKAAVVATTCSTVAALPAGVVGDRKCVSDQLTACPAIDGTFTGSGAVVCSAFYNGTAWVHS